MKLISFVAIVCISASTFGDTDKSRENRERSEDVSTVAEQLKGFENGSVSLEKLTLEGGSPLRQEIIRYYTNNANRVSVKMKLVVSRCFGMEHDAQNAAQLAESYVAVYTNDYRGWRILGSASGLLDRHDRALEAYMKATKLGDEASYSPMAGVALEVNRLDVVREIVPQLIKLKHSKDIPKFVKLDIVGFLSVYARRTDDREVFLKALEGVKSEDIVSRDDVAVAVDKACKKFQATEVEAICQKVHEAVQRKATDQKK